MVDKHLLKRIAEVRNDMIDLAVKVGGDNPFADAGVYAKSCQLDQLIVEFMKVTSVKGCQDYSKAG